MYKSISYLIVFVIVAGLSLSTVQAANPYNQDSGENGIVSMEAENYHDIVNLADKAWEFVTEPTGFLGTGAMRALPNTGTNNNAGYVTTSPRMDYEIVFTKTGTHYVWVRGHTLGDGGSDSWHTGLDGLAVTTADRGALDAAADWEWHNGDMDGGRVTLDVASTGVHVLNIWMREDGAILDKIVLTTSPTYTPFGEGPDLSLRLQASNENPADGTEDILRNALLSWISGANAVTQDVYFGTNFDDVNNASRTNSLGVLASEGQVATTFNLGLLDLGQTYFWRIDGVGAAPGNTIYPGVVWSFTVEPVSYPIPFSNITATASSSTGDPNAPNRTIDGSGLNESDQHSTADDGIWLSAAGNVSAWLQYEFDKPYKLDKLLVWNGNTLVETAIGWGFKDITLETSLDGVTWAVVDGVTQLTQATSQDDYGPGDTIVLDNITAKYVRITALSNWGGILPQYALSEVRFYFFPTYAREPQPDTGINTVPPVVAGWRAGREATEHTLSLDSDANAVQNGTAASQTVQTATLDLGSFGLLLGETYFWQVNEINDAMDPSQWPGDLWSFSISDPLVIDDFESYANQSPLRPFQTWIDGLGYSADDFLPDDPGNNTGAAVGHDIWSPGSEHFNGTVMEQTLIHGGEQSLPLYYNNSGAEGKLTYSEMTRSITTNQDWTQYGISTLVLYFRGMEGNTGQLYVKINNTKVLYTDDAAALSRPLWQQWNIDLSAIGGNVSNVQSFTVGIEDAGSGLVYVDNVLLYRDAPPVPVPVDPGNAGLMAAYSMENNVNDSSGQGRNATAIGNPVYAAGPTGLGSALSFDGLEDYVDLPIGSVISSATDITVACWVDYAANGGAWQRIFDIGTGTTANMFLIPAVNVTGNMRFAITTGGSAGESQVDAPWTLPTGWHHLAVTIDSSTMSISMCMDGEVVGTGPTEVLPQDLGETTQNWLGRSQYTADAFFEGALDEVLIYDRALSIPEIRYLAGDR